WKGIVQLYKYGMDLKGGGVASALAGIPLLYLFGKTGAAITIILLIFVFFMLLTGATLIDLFRTAFSPVKSIGESYVQTVEEKELEIKKPASRFNIDIPIDQPVSEPMPQHPVKSPKGSMDNAQALIFAKDKLLNNSEPPKAETAKQQEIKQAADAAKPKDDKSLHIDDIISKLVQSEQPQQAEQKTDELEPEQQAETESMAEKLDKALDGSVAEAQNGNEDAFQADGTENIYSYPSISLLNEGKPAANDDISEELKANAARLVDTLKSFGVQTRIVDISRGPAVTRYELQPSAGVKISKITGLADDIALNLAAAGVRIEAPIPNKAAVGIEVPNKVISAVTIREIIDSPEFIDAKSRLTIALGKDIAGNNCVADIAKMPHVLIAGSTGSGKSVCINSIIASILFKASPDEVKLLMVDPKVVELGVYNGIPHLLVPVVTEPKKAAGALGWAVTEMLNRYKVFAANGVRDLTSYNELAKEIETLHPMPQIVIIIDELADLMMAAPNEVEDSICRLAQMARAAGMHLVIATQRPSVDVITGVIKANIPSRIAFAVSSQVDSRTILDSAGAEKLLGRGDMLFYPVGASKPVRVQGCFITDKEIERVVSYIKQGDKAEYDQTVVDGIEKHAVADKGEKKKDSNDGGGFSENDEMLPAAIECVIEAGQASTSLLQRRLKLGYARAARIIDEMEARGIVGPFEGSKPRPVLITRDRWIEMKLNQD
ncbi:MAG TPA: DNA translocase FtsK, partial [Ruminococcaceae bacterium]|nr:DNA translocase FtsK [Oscillospiraceae bacterium]